MEEQKEFLEQQLQWTKEQIRILDEMDKKLQEMKKIAEYAATNDLSVNEREELNRQLEMVKNEYSSLERQRHTGVH